MSSTEQNVLSYVRKLQREMIKNNLNIEKLKKMDVLDEVILAEKKGFKNNMIKKFPELEKMLDEGKVLKSKPWVDKGGSVRYRTYTLDEYNEFATRQTIMNMDRTCAQEDALQNEERVVEFYLRDNRTLKTRPFPECQIGGGMVRNAIVIA